MNEHHVIGVYAGSFDPLTNGHMYMITEGAKLFDQLVVAIGINAAKNYTFTLEERLKLLRECVKGIDNVKVETFENRFLVKYAEEIKCKYILRGIRNESDYEFERTMRNVNGDLNSEISTVFLMPPRQIAETSSSFVKGLVGPQGWETVIKTFVPKPVYRALLNRFKDVHT